MGDNKENKRTANFTSMEESTLIALVSKYRDVIECKKTDSENCRKKKNVWVQVAEEFNAICAGTHRTSDILLNKYRNLKKRVKKKFADEKCYTQGTGGGPQKKIKITNTDEELKDILGSQITGLTSEFDDDRVILIVEAAEEPRVNTSNSEPEVAKDIKQKDNESLMVTTKVPTSKLLKPDFSIPSSSTGIRDWSSYNQTTLTPKAKTLNTEVVHSDPEPEISKVSKMFETDESIRVTTKAPFTDLTKLDILTPSTSKSTRDWSSYCPAALKTPKAKALNTKVRGQSRNKITNRLCSWAETKSETASLQCKIMLEKHELYMQQQREKHAAEMRFAEEEHKLKMELLKKQWDNK